MKTTSLITFLILFIQSACVERIAATTVQSHKHSLNDISFKYQYENGSAIRINFSDNNLTYKWIEGPNKSKPVRTYPYKLRVLSNNTYYVNWHEIDNKNFITLLFDFNSMEAFSSVIVKYKNNEPFTTFERAEITEFKDNKASSKLPYAAIPNYDAQYNPGNILKRIVDGLGYRYHWATEGLTHTDLGYKPSKDARDTRQTLEHLYGLAETIFKAAQNQPSVRPANWSNLSFVDLRRLTLEKLQKASEMYKNKTAEEISELKVVFEFNGNRSEFPFWNMINGPISDALYHTGQIVSFRRSSGNPINPKVNVFMGKTGK